MCVHLEDTQDFLENEARSREVTQREIEKQIISVLEKSGPISFVDLSVEVKKMVRLFEYDLFRTACYLLFRRNVIQEDTEHRIMLCDVIPS